MEVDSVMKALKPVPIREYINAFFSYNESIDIYHTINMLKTNLRTNENLEKMYISVSFEGTHMQFDTTRDLIRFLDK